ncbi:MAG: hypothetical protein A3I77_06710 [Gammaproteobacteria bacterium RIFCSPLOWO2_02_FULL_42_14]|nr:MAG: hypothetical protein A3B71_02550 [Gammaproteobacteria bacterium RIFCSPHIGHO2_02_FULL_42_43]OGT28888.1 MAG: hypothetical protein A2624_06925 [Gammaproteobacteria bacterium RIFCSPHIGHO2_01_FULL_42_8]OGT61060.1 MAG: hypothetical protein A3I77_06710 [Gammaproteobacteria bacterium RIFCSPLOWO2_02_FULL_42_14]OGT86987.1 MAG: hypothetical protein A3G86_00430 [Gammaproteobacteria bacterium RIFCSPLOWO2_12_FULL_42_18]
MKTIFKIMIATSLVAVLSGCDMPDYPNVTSSNYNLPDSSGMHYGPSAAPTPPPPPPPAPQANGMHYGASAAMYPSVSTMNVNNMPSSNGMHYGASSPTPPPPPPKSNGMHYGTEETQSDE